MSDVHEKTALLIMDFQNGVVAMTPGAAAAVPTMVAVRRRAKQVGILVVYVTVGFRRGYPEIGRRSPAFAPARDHGVLQIGNVDQAIHDDLRPAADDVIVTKHRRGPFYATDLDQILRINEIETLVLAGITTSGVVLTAVRNAADRDYDVVVLADCCADHDPEVHRVLMEKVFPAQADVKTAEEWLRCLDAGRAEDPCGPIGH
jgi:nicotinamidase-related amidase